MIVNMYHIYTFINGIVLQIDCGNHSTSFPVSNLHITATATEMNILPGPISFATSTSVISKFQTHLHTMNYVAQTKPTNKMVPGSPEIHYWFAEPRSAFDWNI